MNNASLSGPAIDLQKMPILAKKIIFSDEAHFDLGRYVNKQNCRIWGPENLHAYIEKPTHPKRVTVWCEFWSRGIIGQFFFENEQGEAVTVNGDLYRAMLNEFLFTKVEEEDIDNIWLQQDDATCHTVEATLDVLRPVFEDRIISRKADVDWPPRSYDLTLLDYYLWSAVKDKCYAEKPETIDALKDNIRKAIGEIQLHRIDNVLKNYSMAKRGSHLDEIEMIVLSNKKRNLRKYSVVFFKAFSKQKSYLADPVHRYLYGCFIVLRFYNTLHLHTYTPYSRSTKSILILTSTN